MISRNGQSAHRSAAFTLTEILVAVGAIAIITVGLASVFESVGSTVSRGKRIQVINETARRIEGQMRSDIGRMTRDGFLVIRNETVSGRQLKVYIDAEDSYPRPNVDGGVFDDPRPRRVDELMFFAKGRFESARMPIHPDLRATANAARIYYGPGTRFDTDVMDAPEAYYTPELDHAYGSDGSAGSQTTGNTTVIPSLRRGSQGSAGVGERGPNEMAIDWTLLRHVTLLAPPNQISNNPISGTTIDPRRAVNSRYQIGGQPACATIFQSLTNHYPFQQLSDPTPSGGLLPPLPAGVVPNSSTLRNPLAPGTGMFGPMFASGIIDIATQSLGDIRKIVLGAADSPQNVYSNSPVSLDIFTDPDLTPPLPARPVPLVLPTFLASFDTALLQQQWMVDALPGNTLGQDVFSNRDISDNLLRATRMRFEPEPPAYFASFDPAQAPPPLGNSFAIDGEIRRADQLMLSSSNFVPHCTEFIVEWSFGETVPGRPVVASSPARVGELIWHGYYRPGDIDGDGTIKNNNDEMAVMPYPWYQVKLGSLEPNPWKMVEQEFTKVQADGTIVAATRPIPPELIHPELNALPRVPKPVSDEHTPMLGQLTSCFGYIDPTWIPAANSDEPSTIDWPWPKLIRVTIGLVDPKDPSIEQTFTFVFDVPDDRTN